MTKGQFDPVATVLGWVLSCCFSTKEKPPEFLSRLCFEIHGMRIATNDAKVFREDLKILFLRKCFT